MTAPSPRYDEVSAFLRAHRSFLLSGHVRADGDCLGAEVVLYHLLRGLGKEVVIVNPDPIAPRYAFLTQDTPITHYRNELPGGGLPRAEVLCVLDVAVLARTAPVGEAMRRQGARTLVIDHHQPQDGETWDEQLLDPAAPASGVLVYRLAKRMGIALPRPALEAVFVSLTTDTGWFKYGNTDRECFDVAAELVAGGVDPSAVYGKLYQRYPAEYPVGIGVALRSLRYEAGGRLAVAVLRQAELEAAGAQLSETDDVLDLLRSVGAVDAVLLFRENASGRSKCSARSKGTLDVNALMKRFGGGGHTRAAGADLAAPMDEAIERVVQAAVEALDAR